MELGETENMEKKSSVRTDFFSGLMLMLCGGAIAGVGFNVVFGAWAFSGEGILAVSYTSLPSR